MVFKKNLTKNKSSIQIILLFRGVLERKLPSEIQVGFDFFSSFLPQICEPNPIQLLEPIFLPLVTHLTPKLGDILLLGTFPSPAKVFQWSIFLMSPAKSMNEYSRALLLDLRELLFSPVISYWNFEKLLEFRNWFQRTLMSTQFQVDHTGIVTVRSDAIMTSMCRPSVGHLMVFQFALCFSMLSALFQLKLTDSTAETYISI